MSKEPTRTDLPAGDFISGKAVRAGFGRRRPTSRTTSANAHSSTDGEDTSRTAGGARRLRRWSVAELIARAVAPPSSTT